MKSIPVLFVCSILYFSPIFAKTSLQPTNPKGLCSRYVGEEPIKECEKKIKKMGPDWYLSTVCSPLFEDKDFWDCLSLSKKANFPPHKLEKCNSEGHNDLDRMNCVKNLAAKNLKESAFQDAKLKAKNRRRH